MSAVSHMALIGRNGIVGLSPSASFTDSALDTTDGTATYTFASKNFAIGTAATNRLVVVTVHMISTSNNTLSSGTIGGVAATIIGTASGSASNFAQSAIMCAVVPTGTAAQISLTWSSSSGNYRTQVGVYAVYNLASPIKVASITGTTNNSAASLSPTTGVIGIGAATAIVGSTPSYAWTNLTKDLDTQGEAVNERYSAASFYNASGISSVTANAVSGSTTNFSLIAATWT